MAERKRERETGGQKHDLPRSMFNSEDHERRDKGEMAVIMGKGERINVLTKVEDYNEEGEINNIPWQFQ